MRSILLGTLLLLLPALPAFSGPQNGLPGKPASPAESPAGPASSEPVTNPSIEIPTKEEPSQSGVEIARPAWESIQVTRESHYEEQIKCPPSDCAFFRFDENAVDDWLSDRMAENSGRILIDLGNTMPGWNDERLNGLKEYLRQTAKRDGRVLVEPMYINVRGEALAPPSILDVFTTSYSIAKRIYYYFRYRKTGNYHAKILYNPIDRSIGVIYFVHKRYGDICTTLFSQCDVIEYLDEETFDLALSHQLEESSRSSRPVRLVFHSVPAYLPSGELTVTSLRNANTSARLYKWMVAAKETEKVRAIRSRFLPFEAVVAAVKYSIQAYDLISALIMYAPARRMKAQIVYEGEESGGTIRSVVFTPTGPGP